MMLLWNNIAYLTRLSISPKGKTLDTLEDGMITHLRIRDMW